MPKEVEMDEIAVSCFDEETSSTASPLLLTEGISTCIAIILHGRVNGRNFCAFYHWPGFPDYIRLNIETEGISAIYNVFINIEEKIRKKFIITSSYPITITAITIIGGEKKQINEHDELKISGTEAEVNLLKKYTAEICTEMFEVNPGVNPVFRNFLTKGASSIDIQVYANSIHYQKDSGKFFDQTRKDSRKRKSQEAEPDESCTNKKRL
jgi:hypothetical protein